MNTLLKWNKFFESNSIDIEEYLLSLKEKLDDLEYSYRDFNEYLCTDDTTQPDYYDMSVKAKLFHLQIDLNSEFENISNFKEIISIYEYIKNISNKSDNFGIQEVRYQFLESCLTFMFVYKFTDDMIFNTSVEDLRSDSDNYSSYVNGVSCTKFEFNKDLKTVTLYISCDKDTFDYFYSTYMEGGDGGVEYESIDVKSNKNTHIVTLTKPKFWSLPDYEN